MSTFEILVRYPKEKELIASIVMGYTDLEFALSECVEAIGNSEDTVTKVMYRTRGETARIEVADAFGRQMYKAIGIDSEFCMAIGYMRRCLKIRNNYAHCLWWDFDDTGLGFINMEDAAVSNKPINEAMMTKARIDVPLLTKQSEFFASTDHWLTWLKFEALVSRKLEKENFVDKPGPLKMPAPYIEPEESNNLTSA